MSLASLCSKAAAPLLYCFMAVGVALGGPTGPARAASPDLPGGEDADRSLSPYFQVTGGDESLDRLPLKSTRASVEISGVIARVTLEQEFGNDGKHTLEAVYIFPASTRAAVNAMKMTVGERVITAQIAEKEAARRRYEEAKAQGRTASLLEQQRPNVFQMNVANILPGDKITVSLTYTELLRPQEGVYRFVLPVVVGPRYSNTPESQAGPDERWVANPYLHEGEPAPYTFGLQLKLASPLPIAKAQSPSHPVQVEFSGRQEAHLSLPPAAAHANRDFILEYTLAGDQVQSGVMLYQGKEENFFLLMLEPPVRVTPAQVTPREYIFVVDVSGSMHGFPLETCQELMSQLAAGLGPQDSFNLVLFAGGSAVLSPRSLPANRENLARAREMLARERGGGGTELLPALEQALNLPREENKSRVVVLLTDGYVSVEREAFELVSRNLGRANLFVFGIGSAVNRHLIEGLAQAGQGEPAVVTRPQEAKARAARFRDYIGAPVLTGVTVEAQGFPATELEPPALPDLFSRRPVILFGKYTGPAQGALVVRGHGPAGPFTAKLPLSPSLVSPDNAALAQLWARARLTRLADLTDRRGLSDNRQAIIELGLKYSLMSPFTSFVAVDTVVRADGKKSVTVREPLPLPQGVSDNAVGRMAPGAARGLMKYSAAAPPPPPPGRPLAALPEMLARMVTPETESARPQPTPPPVRQVRLASLELEGPQDPAAVTTALTSHLPSLPGHLARQQPGAVWPAKVKVALRFAADGALAEVRVLEPTGDQGALVRALTAALESFTLPGGQAARLTCLLVY
ncbi:MAG: VIT and VWA domain-containing protein [Deltaproteobacteria bacterium]|nr:VIT and VWA domain-containing protein [Deltaproteobacteria bacterium]